MFTCALIFLHPLELMGFMSPSAVFLNGAYAFCSTSGTRHTWAQVFCTLKCGLCLMWVDFLNCGETVFQAISVCHFVLEDFALWQERIKTSHQPPHFTLHYFASDFMVFLMEYTLTGQNVSSKIVTHFKNIFATRTPIRLIS